MKAKTRALFKWSSLSGILFAVGWLAFSEVIAFWGFKNVTATGNMTTIAPIFASIFCALVFALKYKELRGEPMFSPSPIARQVVLGIIAVFLIFCAILRIRYVLSSSYEAIATIGLTISWGIVGALIGGFIGNTKDILHLR